MNENVINLKIKEKRDLIYKKLKEINPSITDEQKNDLMVLILNYHDSLVEKVLLRAKEEKLIFGD